MIFLANEISLLEHTGLTYRLAYCGNRAAMTAWRWQSTVNNRQQVCSLMASPLDMLSTPVAHWFESALNLAVNMFMSRRHYCKGINEIVSDRIRILHRSCTERRLTILEANLPGLLRADSLQSSSASRRRRNHQPMLRSIDSCQTYTSHAHET